jgi:F-type H+-transporting ATPase subunit delta
MKNIRVARRYAQALMDAAEKPAALEQTARDLETIGTTLEASRDLRLMLASPVVPGPKKRAVLDALFGASVGRGTMLFLHLLLEKQREQVLQDIIREFFLLRDARLGIISVDVAAAIELTDKEQDSLHTRLERHTGKKVRVRFTRDVALKGGLMVKIGDTVLDASVKRQLERLKERFARGGSAGN